MSGVKGEWPLYEVFVRGKRGLNHVHVGSLHAADDEMAVRHARDVYTRRNEGVSIWVVRADAITASGRVFLITSSVQTGISKAPGTRYTVMTAFGASSSSSSRPASRSPWTN